jgi:hypothetical protein
MLENLAHPSHRTGKYNGGEPSCQKCQQNRFRLPGPWIAHTTTPDEYSHLVLSSRFSHRLSVRLSLADDGR